MISGMKAMKNFGSQDIIGKHQHLEICFLTQFFIILKEKMSVGYIIILLLRSTYSIPI